VRAIARHNSHPVDFRLLLDETASVTIFAAPRLAPWRRFATALALGLGAVGTSACDRVQKALNPEPGDPVWRSDSTLLASKPPVLLRVVRTDSSTRIVPIATVGEQGYRPLSLGNRGWRAFDLAYLQSTASLTPLRDGDGLSALTPQRGMWEGPALDSIPGCTVILPGAQAALPAGVQLLLSGPRPPLNPTQGMDGSELQRTLAAIPTLIAPTVGISMSLLPRYRREVHVISTGATAQPSIVVTFDDPEVVSDTVPMMGQRPRQLVLVLDKGIYGYKPSYTFSTVGNNKSAPRLRYLGYVDVDGDRKAELLFGLQTPRAPLYTIFMRFEADAWREMAKYERGRCQS